MSLIGLAIPNEDYLVENFDKLKQVLNLQYGVSKLAVYIVSYLEDSPSNRDEAYYNRLRIYGVVEVRDAIRICTVTYNAVELLAQEKLTKTMD